MSNGVEIMELLERKSEHRKQENEIKKRLLITRQYPKTKQYFKDGNLVIAPYRVVETENYGTISITDWIQGEHLTLLASDAEYIMFKRKDSTPMFIAFYSDVKDNVSDILIEIHDIVPMRTLAERFPTETELEKIVSFSK